MDKYKNSAIDFKINGKWVKTYTKDGVCCFTRAFKLWCGLTQRCKGEATQRNSPSYVGCKNIFEDFQHFAEWCQDQIGYTNHDDGGRPWQLDKDILVKGNKTYSAETCCFVPKALNTLLEKRANDRGEYPIGVYLDGKYFAGRVGRKLLYSDHLRKRFSNPEQAFAFYKEEKEHYIKEVADFYKDRIDPRVYEALYKYEVHIDD